MKGTGAGVVWIFFGGTVWVLSYSDVPYEGISDSRRITCRTFLQRYLTFHSVAFLKLVHLTHHYMLKAKHPCLRTSHYWSCWSCINISMLVLCQNFNFKVILLLGPHLHIALYSLRTNRQSGESCGDTRFSGHLRSELCPAVTGIWAGLWKGECMREYPQATAEKQCVALRKGNWP